MQALAVEPPILDRIEYVAGFMFNDTLDEVVLIYKNKPAWMANKFNAVGGKVEPLEAPMVAMRREFEEETGVNFVGWQPFAELTGIDQDGRPFIVYWYAAKSALAVQCVQSMEDEGIEIHNLIDIEFNNDIYVYNLGWFVQMAAARLHSQDRCNYFKIDEANYS